MAKTLEQFLEVYRPKSADEQRFVDKHVTVKNKDRNGNGDDVFQATNIKTVDRKKDRKGYNPGEDDKVYEELKGNQHKIDANKNGKVDAHDFHLLRKKKKVAEEAEELEELETATLQSYRKKARAQGNKIIDNMKVGGGDWSKDQVNTKTLRKRSAGAQMSGKILRKRGESLKTEEVEDLDESAKVAAHLIKRYGDNVRKSHVRSAANDFGVDASKLAKAVRVKLGVNRLEEEQLDEIGNTPQGKATLRSYVNKAVTRVGTQGITAGLKIANNEKSKANIDSMNKRQTGIGRAVDRLTKEEVEEYFYDITTEANANLLMSVFEELNADNQQKFIAMCESEEGLDKALDFSIKASRELRGE